MSDKQERIMWYAISIGIIMLLFPPYYNHFAEFPAQYPSAGNVHTYGWFLSRPRNTDGVDMALQMAQLGILGLLSFGYILSLGKREREMEEYIKSTASWNSDQSDKISMP